MTKLEQAARALLVHWDTPAWKYLKPTGDLMAALREALDHSGEANEMVEFFSKEMKNKISVARAEQAEQEPVAWMRVPTFPEQVKRIPEQVERITEYKVFNDDIPIYAAPVRTKDLTDDEIEALAEQFVGQQSIALCRAVIAKDRELNK